MGTGRGWASLTATLHAADSMGLAFQRAFPTFLASAPAVNVPTTNLSGKSGVGSSFSTRTDPDPPDLAPPPVASVCSLGWTPVTLIIRSPAEGPDSFARGGEDRGLGEIPSTRMPAVLRHQPTFITESLGRPPHVVLPREEEIVGCPKIRLVVIPYVAGHLIDAGASSMGLHGLENPSLEIVLRRHGYSFAAA